MTSAPLISWRCRCGAQSNTLDPTEESARARLRLHQLDFDCANLFPKRDDAVRPLMVSVPKQADVAEEG